MATTTDNYLTQAALKGRERGKGAATWAVTPNSQHAWMLKGIEDGAPMVIDAIGEPSWLSGEWADEPTPRSLLSDLGYDLPEGTEHADEILRCYEEAASESYWAEVERLVRYYL